MVACMFPWMLPACPGPVSEYDLDLRHTRAGIGIAIWRRAAAMVRACQPRLSKEGLQLLFGDFDSTAGDSDEEAAGEYMACREPRVASMAGAAVDEALALDAATEAAVAVAAAAGAATLVV
eukprot:gnl/TRDRNA2_/TRDRNA2_120632_c1_seq1.p3 gnl/TRDRNA2_/TRDRNA2_120632_c1~~gnl/TRDRNA2_/TRDRNA2_120632_c1_seq1.p3  ORF type:complete len:121 (+),score=20.46 gnl/TRDRNA2_/TRDRNA2_120632_c1_seq1:377-739(+)